MNKPNKSKKWELLALPIFFVIALSIMFLVVYIVFSVFAYVLNGYRPDFQFIKNLFNIFVALFSASIVAGAFAFIYGYIFDE